MEKEFVPYELALRMEALGFNKPCFGSYRGNDYFSGHLDIAYSTIDNLKQYKWLSPTLAPTWQQAFKWFREKYDLSGWVDESFGGSLRRGVVSIKSEIGSEYYPTTTKLFYTYEEAELDCLTNLIEIVEQKENI